ncbi:TPM domain-containing protein [Zhongshania aliphaticivorans]|uniref:Methanol dehydrogenase n=1 Tax=Zhongshania aliphaticivorans TaxID=1470434 RepID=A0A127MAB0_9GAMM|nr:TPM domain-containing protein [Zhongshania aliphaticivorans]AMO70182.1 methanol dehydrogenase [Zhongshania aliphaticivorans]
MRLFLTPLLIVCSLLFSLSALAAEPEFPKLSGRVVDNAKLLSAATEQDLNRQLAAQEQRTDNQIVVVTLPDLQGYEISDYGFQLGRHWGIGQKDANNGALLIIAMKERKMRIEVGYGLEGLLTDARSAQIIQQILTPAFKSSDFDGGVKAAVEAMVLIIDGKPAAIPKTQQANKKSPPKLGGLLLLIIIFLMMSGGRGGRGFLGGALLGAALGSRHGGGFGGGGFGGGGFGGGGGGFGGGGASGGW